MTIPLRVPEPVTSIVTARSAERFRALRRRLVSEHEPGFLDHDRSVRRHWARLPEAYPDFQFCLIEEASGLPIGIGYCVPIDFVGPWSSLPAGGLDWVLERAFSDHAVTESKVASALYILVDDRRRGQGWSTRMLAAMRDLARSRGAAHLIAPVRPSGKAAYPLVPIETYCQWHTDRQERFDPWIRAHCRVGGTVLHPCHESMVVEASVTDWTSWTGLQFLSAGDYVIPGGHVPLVVADGRGHYREPGVWLLHACG